MLNAILLHMISCFICFVILALPVPTLIQVYVRGSGMAFSHGRSSKNGLWLHLGFMLGAWKWHFRMGGPQTMDFGFILGLC